MMGANIAFILMVVAMGAVLVSLGSGIILMAKGGELNKKYGNKIMQARVMLQGIAVLLLVVAALLSQH